MANYDSKTGIFKEHKYKVDAPLAESIYTTFNPESIVDLGCGDGKYCKIWKDMGCKNVQGYEGNKKCVNNSTIKFMDLTKDNDIQEKYDLLVCLEVGEHIPHQYENIFIDNILSFAEKNIVLSWAVPGQKGKGHVNCKKNEEVISIFCGLGFYYNAYISEYLRKNSKLKWFKNTIMNFWRY